MNVKITFDAKLISFVSALNIHRVWELSNRRSKIDNHELDEEKELFVIWMILQILHIKLQQKEIIIWIWTTLAWSHSLPKQPNKRFISFLGSLFCVRIFAKSFGRFFWASCTSLKDVLRFPMRSSTSDILEVLNTELPSLISPRTDPMTAINVFIIIWTSLCLQSNIFFILTNISRITLVSSTCDVTSSLNFFAAFSNSVFLTRIVLRASSTNFMAFSTSPWSMIDGNSSFV